MLPEHQAQVEQMHKVLHGLVERVARLYEENAAAPPAEQLPPEALVVNTKHAEELKAETVRAVNEAKAIMNQSTAEAEARALVIRQECWDPMEVHGRKITALGAPLSIPNYPICKIKKGKDQMRSKLLCFRMTQWVMQGGNASTTPPTPLDLLYPPTSLITRERQTIQIELLTILVQQRKEAFNARHDATLKMKSEDLMKVNERLDRMRAVVSELSVCAEIHDQLTAAIGEAEPAAREAAAAQIGQPLDLRDEEVPERALTVEDHEISVPKVLSEEEEARIIAQKKAELERTSNHEDNARERALQMMMGGKLQKEERKIGLNIPRPDFIDTKPKNEWSEDERKIVKEYEKKVLLAREEHEKYRKALETEFRKLEASVEELKTGFDARVHALLEEKLQSDHLIYQDRLRAVLLARRIVHIRNLEKTLVLTHQQAKSAQEHRTALAANVPEIKEQVDVLREVHDGVVKKDKEVERAFKREFMPTGPGAIPPPIPADTLWRLFRKRDEHGGGDLGDSDFVAGLTQGQWATLCDLRLKKVQTEVEVRKTIADTYICHFACNSPNCR
jgi:hypothetical protein